MQMDSDLVIYRTTLVRTFQVVTICRVDKSEEAKQKRSTATCCSIIKNFGATWVFPMENRCGSLGSDDEKEPDVVDAVEKERETTIVDKMDNIYRQIITETEQMETDLVEPGITRSAEIGMEHSIAVNDEDDNLDGAENDIARKMSSATAPEQFLKEPLRSGEDTDMSGFKQPSRINETEEPDVVEPVVVEITETVAIDMESRIDALPKNL
ncbi:splicing factor 3B subunit 1-like [Dorcoceras hygrometricum]|uniref:Splicing factor 3B subunit 1-like n=1 Tax=Dorcoceras hygrometricum TaxID=472368 RepID=A0A2Z7CZH7_9LAMI|nr:splicing factor 3B subunit 1-like [Dorcoceras hygrometricum]